MRLGKLALVLCAMGFSFSSQAELIQTDWKVENDNRVVFDTESGVEWLKLSETDSKSISYVMSQLGEGGLYEGWSLATYDQVDEMLGYAYDNISPGKFVNLFGYTRSYYYGTAGSGYTRYWSAGYVHNVENDKVYYSGAWNGGGSSWSPLSETSVSITHSSVNVGVYLVSTGGVTWSSLNDESVNSLQNVSAPLSMAIGGLGLMLLGSRRKKFN